MTIIQPRFLANTKQNRIYAIAIIVGSLAAGNTVATEAVTNSKTEYSKDAAMNQFYDAHPLLCAKPEFGVDIGFVRAKFKADQGDKMFNRNILPINVFFGWNITDRLGVEIGYSETRRKHKDITLGPGEAGPGTDLIDDPNEFESYNTSASLSQPSINLKYKYNINNKWSFYGAVGFSVTKLNLDWQYQSGVFEPISPDATFRTGHMEIRKIIPTVKAGLYYQINNAFAIRALCAWQQTSKLNKYIDNKTIHGIPTNLKAKDYMQYSIGIVYSI